MYTEEIEFQVETSTCIAPEPLCFFFEFFGMIIIQSFFPSLHVPWCEYETTTILKNVTRLTSEEANERYEELSYFVWKWQLGAILLCIAARYLPKWEKLFYPLSIVVAMLAFPAVTIWIAIVLGDTEIVGKASTLVIEDSHMFFIMGLVLITAISRDKR